MPHVGPVTRDKIRYNQIYPPATGIADDYPLEDGTSAYLVCGALTSLSSFVRQDLSSDCDVMPSLSSVLRDAYISNSPDSAVLLIEQMIKSI